MKINNRGQFSIIAALLVAIILVAAVMSTYSAIRYSTTQDQPQVLTAVDETNAALKQLLGYTVGYYGSVLQVTGNSTYGKDDAQHGAKKYLYDGINNIIEMHPDWGLSVNVSSIRFDLRWYSNESYSFGALSVKYDLTGLGLTGLSYASNCTLSAQVLPSVSGGPAIIRVLQDNGEPLTTLTKDNFKLYNYSTSDQTWNLTDVLVEPEVFSNGTYSILLPSGMDASVCMLQVKDARGLMVVGSAFNKYDSTFTPSSDSSGSAEEDYVDQMTDAYAPAGMGSHSDFSQQNATDGSSDTLTEAMLGPQTLTLHPSGSGTSSLSIHGGSANWNCVSDTGSGDGDSTYVYRDTSSGYPSFTVDTYATEDASVSGTINSVTVRMRAKSYNLGGTGYACTVLRSGGNNYQGTSVVLTSSYTVYSTTYSNNPAGGAWTWSAINSLQCGVGLTRTSGGGEVRCTQVWVEVNYTSADYGLDLEERFTNVNYSQPAKVLCIYTGNLGTPDSEPLKVDAWTGSQWTPMISSLLPNQWNNVSVSSFVTGSNFTFRFSGGNDVLGDPTQTSWQIDAVLLRLSSATSNPLPVQDSTIAIEWLQNGTMRWLGQSLYLTTGAKPIPPLPVRTIHLNQTFVNGTNREIPFQVEDWASDYSVPLGLTSNVTIFSNRQMIVFLLTSDVMKVTLWWNGSDTANQTPLAYTDTQFTTDNPDGGHISNGILNLNIEIVNIPADNANVFRVNATKGSSLSSAKFMRINNKNSTYGAGEAFVIHHGIVRDVIQQEAEWSNGVDNCSNVYSNIVLTLPAHASYYTYQLKLTFIDSTTQPRTITDLVPIQLYSSPSSVMVQTENGTSGSTPNVVNGTGTFKDYDPGSGWTAHHWSQIINSGTLAGAGIMFTDASNQQLYAFDSTASARTGALNVSSLAKTIEVAPVTALGQVSGFTTPNNYDITWYGAVATFDGSTSPIYNFNGGAPTGLWLLVERQPTSTVTPET
jgi:uncharacterized protein (UPF0333 family)